MNDTIKQLIRRYTWFIWPKITNYGPQYKPVVLKELSHTSSLSTIDNTPIITIIIPSYQQGEYIEHTIKSLINQNYSNLEIIVVDGGSKDETINIIKKYDSFLTWWCSEKDDGQAHAINKGFSKGSGQIMAWLNSDDMLMPDTLKRVANFFQQNQKVDVVYGHRILIDERNREIGRWTLPHHNDRMLSWMFTIPQETVFWRREMWDKIGCQLDENFKFAMDWDLLIRFRDRGATIIRLPYYMGLFRIHASQKTNVDISSIGYFEMQKLRKKCLGYTPHPDKVSLHTLFHMFAIRFYELMVKFKIFKYE